MMRPLSIVRWLFLKNYIFYLLSYNKIFYFCRLIEKRKTVQFKNIH